MYYNIREIGSGNMIYFLFASSVHHAPLWIYVEGHSFVYNGISQSVL